MKYLIIFLLLFSLKASGQELFKYDYPGKVYLGEKECKIAIDRSHQQLLDYMIFYEMVDSVIRYRDLFNCSRTCGKQDSVRYYKGRTLFFINQSEYYCAIVFGADAVKSRLYKRPGEALDEIKCECQ